MRVRLATPADVDAWWRIRDDPDAQFWSHVAPCDPQAAEARHRDWFGAMLESDRDILAVAQDERGVVGYARLALEPIGTVSVAVAPEARGHGVGFQLVKAVTEAGPETCQAWIHPSNVASINTFRKVGYRLKEPGFIVVERRVTPGSAASGT